MNILLVDDDEDTNFLMGILMKKSRAVDLYEIESRAEKAIELLLEGKITPDFIFVDLNMPEMNGFRFVEIFEQRLVDKLPHTQLFILSSSAVPEDYERAKKYQTVKGFLTKPLTPKKLQEIHACFLDESDFVAVSSPVCYASSDGLRKEFKNPRQP